MLRGAALTEEIAMSTQPAAPAGNAPVPMTQEQLEALMAKAAEKAVGPAVTSALEPLTKAQGDVLARIAGALPKAAEEGTTFNDATLGKYPIGRKLRALVMAGLDNKGNADPDAGIHAIKKAGSWGGASIVEPPVK